MKQNTDRQTASARLFAAVELPAALRLRLGALRHTVPGTRWTPERNLHLTLRFIGETPSDELPLIRQALRSVQLPAFPLKIKGLGFFERKRQSIFWAGLNPSQALHDLKAYVDDALKRRAGLQLKADRFSPHITLARMSEDIPPSLRKSAENWRPDALDHFAVTQFSLFDSALLPDGAVHTLVESYLLN